jgi:glycosyltransferase involved in cell wall biosynthesis
MRMSERLPSFVLPPCAMEVGRNVGTTDFLDRLLLFCFMQPDKEDEIHAESCSTMELGRYKIALAHQWFFAMSGGERVCEAIFKILGNPDVFCIAADRSVLPPSMQHCKFTTSFIQNIPGSQRWYRYLIALFPLAVELLDLREYDLVVSSDAAAIKGVAVSPEACHICYCHSPMRYVWHMFNEYRNSLGLPQRALFSLVTHYIRLWDQSAANRVDYFIANSQTVRRRIRRFYGRNATVIYPPCDVNRFGLDDCLEDYYLFVGRLVRYKRAELAVEVFNKNRKRLLVVGSGPEEKTLKSMAARNVEFLGWVDDAELARLYARCRALVFPGEEDFGIVPVEAQAAGRPVIAYAKGGVTETVLHGSTGILFNRQTAESLDKAIRAFEDARESFDPSTIREHAEQFGPDRFRIEFERFIEHCLEDHEASGNSPNSTEFFADRLKKTG